MATKGGSVSLLEEIPHFRLSQKPTLPSKILLAYFKIDMSEIDHWNYDFLRRKRYIVHDEHRPYLSEQTLKEISQYEPVEFYSREKF